MCLRNLPSLVDLLQPANQIIHVCLKGDSAMSETANLRSLTARSIGQHNRAGAIKSGQRSCPQLKLQWAGVAAAACEYALMNDFNNRTHFVCTQTGGQRERLWQADCGGCPIKTHIYTNADLTYETKLRGLPQQPQPQHRTAVVHLTLTLNYTHTNIGTEPRKAK